MSSLVDSIFGAGGDGSKSAGAETGAAAALFDTKIEIPERPIEEAPPKRKQATAETKQRKKPRKTAKQPQSEDEKATNATDHNNNEDADQPVDDVEARTLFVGNLPAGFDRKALHKLFASHGKIQSTRIRSVAVMGVKLPAQHAGNQALVQKVCANTGQIDRDVKACCAGYVVFDNAASIDRALAMNGSTVQGRHLRVDRAKAQHDPARTVFCGNLPYHADEETLARHFQEKLGTSDDDQNIIENVRIVRDPATGQCKGFAYVLFRDASTVSAALQAVHESLYHKRPLRVQVCGKRYKNQQGATTRPKARQRRQEQAATAVGALQRVLKQKLSSSTTRKRAVRKTPTTGAKATAAASGKSKRASKDQKAGQRVKKLEQRLTKGMGKNRHKAATK